MDEWAELSDDELWALLVKKKAELDDKQLHLYPLKREVEVLGDAFTRRFRAKVDKANSPAPDAKRPRPGASQDGAK